MMLPGGSQQAARHGINPEGGRQHAAARQCKRFEVELRAAALPAVGRLSRYGFHYALHFSLLSSAASATYASATHAWATINPKKTLTIRQHLFQGTFHLADLGLRDAAQHSIEHLRQTGLHLGKRRLSFYRHL